MSTVSARAEPSLDRVKQRNDERAALKSSYFLARTATDSTSTDARSSEDSLARASLAKVDRHNYVQRQCEHT
jgi:hypothetical protein